MRWDAEIRLQVSDSTQDYKDMSNSTIPIYTILAYTSFASLSDIHISKTLRQIFNFISVMTICRCFNY